MPGCGKSTIGRALAKTLGKTYVDLDEVIEKNTGMPIPDIFAREGEASFRKYESQAVAEISKQTRQVIACGGGVITGQRPRPAPERPCAVGAAPGRTAGNRRAAAFHRAGRPAQDGSRADAALPRSVRCRGG